MAARERRWIILGDDGRHVSIGQATDPSEDELARAAEGLQAAGLGGWVAILEGGYYQTRGKVSLMMVREIAPPASPWETAVSLFMARRRDSLNQPPPNG